MATDKPKIRVLALPTAGDHDFYDRWYRIGEKAECDRDATVLVVDQHTEVTERFMLSFPNVEYLCTATTGLTHIRLQDPCFVEVISLKGEGLFLKTVRSVSEFAMHSIHRLLSPPYTTPRRTLSGKVIALIGGHGRIGTHMKEVAKAYHMKVIIVDKETTDVKRYFEIADIVSIHLDENERTRNFVSQECLESMPKGSYLINTARASVLDESALLKLLEDRHIHAAALDVVNDRSLFTKCQHVILSPHVAGHTLEDRIKTDEFLVRKLKERLSH